MTTEEKVDVLFARTLLGDEEDESAWEAVTELRLLGTRQIFETAALWCHSGDPVRRSRGADVLAQLGKTSEHPSTIFAEETCQTLINTLQTETVPRVLNSVITALGHIEMAQAIPTIVRFSKHPSDEARFAVAFALGCYPNDDRSIETLIHLTSDRDEDTREWAIFGLASQSERDSPEIRDALLQRLDDSHDDTRNEAIVGLVKRKDLQVLKALQRLLAGDEVIGYENEAVCYLLDVESAPQEWTAEDYRDALKHRFRAEF